MNKLLLAGMLFLLTSFHMYVPVQSDAMWITQRIIEQAVVTPAATNYLQCKVDCITNYCIFHDIPKHIKPITRLIQLESHFKHTAFNKKSKARGCGQHLHHFWEHLLYKVDNGELGKEIKRKGITNTTRYWFRVGYSIEATVMAYKACIEMKKGSVWDGVWMYGGYFKKGADPVSGSNYVKYILEGK